MKRWIEDKLRGYSDRDIRSAREKLNIPRAPGSYVIVTKGELKYICRFGLQFRYNTI